VAKAAPWIETDAEARKHGERTGLETPVVHAVNDVHSMCVLLRWDVCLSQRGKCTAWGVRSQG
jgi:hypothetical protein